MLTPLEAYPRLLDALGGAGNLYLKREDLHPYGSHKGRSVPVMIDHYSAQGDRHFAITGSGNAALAAARHIKNLNANISGSAEPWQLEIFIGNHIEAAKAARLSDLTDANIRIYTKERPLQALTAAVAKGARSLRQSTDDIALLGYEALAAEIIEACPGLGSLWIATSSGTTAEALAKYFAGRSQGRSKSKKIPQIHIVQTVACHPMADAFTTYDGPSETSLAGAIVDKTAYRKAALVPLIQGSGGSGWIVSNDELEAARVLVQEETGLDLSANGVLAIAGLRQALEIGHELPGDTVCLIGGL